MAVASLSTRLHVDVVGEQLEVNQGIVFEQVSEVLNFPTSPRVDPHSWSFPSGEGDNGNKTMVIAGSTGALAASTDGGGSWRPIGVHLPDGLSVAVDMTGNVGAFADEGTCRKSCLLYTSPSPRDLSTSRMPSSA